MHGWSFLALHAPGKTIPLSYPFLSCRFLVPLVPLGFTPLQSPADDRGPRARFGAFLGFPVYGEARLGTVSGPTGITSGQLTFSSLNDAVTWLMHGNDV